MKILIMFLMSILIMVSAYDEYEKKKKFDQFKKKYKKRYNTTKLENEKYQIFKNYLDYIQINNDKYNNGTITYLLKVNEDADLTMDQFIKYRTGLLNRNYRKKSTSTVSTTIIDNSTQIETKTTDMDTQVSTSTDPTTSTTSDNIFETKTTDMNTQSFYLTDTTTSLNDLNNSNLTMFSNIKRIVATKTTIKTTSTAKTTTTKKTTKRTSKTSTKKTTSPPIKQLDYRTMGIISPIKDQKYCGSCYAFAAVAAIEAYWKLKKGIKLSLSEQNIIDCSDNYGNFGCNGGVVQFAFNYVIDNGISNTDNYNYIGSKSNCKFDKSIMAAKISDYGDVPNESLLQEALIKFGPVAVALDARSLDFIFYDQGILLSEACGQRCGGSLNHAALLVGFNDTNNPPYWIIKNSWGIDWGEQGYVRIEKNKNAFAIAKLPCFPYV